MRRLFGGQGEPQMGQVSEWEFLYTFPPRQWVAHNAHISMQHEPRHKLDLHLG